MTARWAVGIDLGTSRSAIVASNGQRAWVESYVGWPKDFGGAGASYMTQTVYMEEMSSAGAPGAYDQGVWLAYWPTML